MNGWLNGWRGERLVGIDGGADGWGGGEGEDRWMLGESFKAIWCSKHL